MSISRSVSGMVRQHRLKWLLRSDPVGRRGGSASGDLGRRRRAQLLALCHGRRVLTAIIFRCISVLFENSEKRGGRASQLSSGVVSGSGMGKRALGAGSC